MNLSGSVNRVQKWSLRRSVCLVVLTLSAVVMGLQRPSRADFILDQSYTDQSDLSASIAEGFQFVGQVFTAGLTGHLEAVSVDVVSYQDDYLLRISIYEAWGDRPYGNALGSMMLGSSSSPLSELILLDRPVFVVSGRQYALVVDYPDGPPNGVGNTLGFWSGSTLNDYSGGGYVLGNVSGGVVQWATAREDLFFRTYVAPVPEPTSLVMYAIGTVAGLGFVVRRRRAA